MTPLRPRLEAGERLVGGIVRMPNTGLVELLGHAGFDYVVLDAEHGPADQLQLQHHLAAADGIGLDVLVRVGSRDPAETLRALDLGATGVVVPHVRSAEEAAAAVAAAHYPPLGERGFATYSRAGRYGLASAEEHLRRAAERTLVIVMIEDAAGVAAAPEILAVPGVDGVFVGPADLAVSLGHPGGTGHAAVVEAIEAVHRAARDARRWVLTIAGTEQQARHQFENGSDPRPLQHPARHHAARGRSGCRARLSGWGADRCGSVARRSRPACPWQPRSTCWSGRSWPASTPSRTARVRAWPPRPGCCCRCRRRTSGTAAASW
ncbi:HpcH/HpaI aldolase family protein [Pseudonocardia nigra]|uniref:HpcH/HpaI aldolase family protein n=1 Tax=Pseudonocardia nigra TaxID=1921578 RepID=UPI001C5FE9F0|nr:aldolase/citrate lyase family protein [Pseudonocardia nigra]